MQRSLYQQAVHMHGQNLSVLTEKHHQGNIVFVEEKNEEQQLADKAEECDERDSSANHPDTTPVAPYQDGVRLTGTMRDLVHHVQSRTITDSSAEESSKSDTSPEILPLGVPRELHEPFEDLPTKQAKLLENNGFAPKLHNFISKKADILFKATAEDKEHAALPNIQDTVDLDYYATLPPMEQFMVVPADQSRKRLFEILAIGDIIAGLVVAIKDFGMFVQVVCLCGKEARYLQECDIVGLLPKGELGDRFSQKAQLEDFRAGDVVRCRVVKTDAANEKVILTMINQPNQGEQNEENLLGIVNESDLPVHYRRSKTQRETTESYDEMLDNTLGFDNPYNISCLANLLSIDDANPCSLVPGLQSSNFPVEEHAEALRKWQSHKWAMESVARGVEHFKASRYLEAMQQLNRALEIDSENVEGLVARGALFANQNNLSKAIKDFAEALRIKPFHKNANRYMCQTLYEKGKQCEEKSEKQKAMDCYQSAVDLNPDFQDALVSLQRLEKPSRRKSVRKESEEEVVISTSDESPEEQMSAKQLREMISEEKSSTKKKKKKEKHSEGIEDGKGDRKVKKELKMGKKKKNKKLRRKSSSPEVISKPKRKEPLSDSESESSEPPSPPPKQKDIKKSSKVDNPNYVLSPEGGRLTGRKRSRNGSLSPKRKSRSKTRKADLIRRKSKHASGSSASDDDKPIELEPKKDKRGHSKSLERSDSTKSKRKDDKNQSRKESDSSSYVSSSEEEEQVKKSKKEGKKVGKDKRAIEEVTPKKRKMKTKKEKVKRSRSSSSVSEESAHSHSQSPMRKKSRQSQKVKKMHKKSKKRSESVSSLSASGSDSERKPSPPRKVHKKKKKNKKKKPKKKERSASVSSPSVLSSDSPERAKSQEESAKKRKHKKKRKEEDRYSDRSGSDSSSSSKISKGKREIKTKRDDNSPAQIERRSRSSSVGYKEQAHKVSSDEEKEEIKIGKKRSRSNEYSLAKPKDHPSRQASKEAVLSSPNERQGRRKTSGVPSDESEKEGYVKRKDERSKKKQSKSPFEERLESPVKEKSKNKEKSDKREDESRSSRKSKRHSAALSPGPVRRERSASESPVEERLKSPVKEKSKSEKKEDERSSRKSKRHSRALSPVQVSRERSASESPVEESLQSPVKEKSKSDKREDERSSRKSKRHSRELSPVEVSKERSASKDRNKLQDKDKKKSRKSLSPASLSPHGRGHAEDHKGKKLAKQSEYSGERSVSREKCKADERDKKKNRRSHSSSSESPRRSRYSEDRKQDKPAKPSKPREESLEKSSKTSRRSRSLSPKTKKQEEKGQGTPVRERKRKRSGSFKDESSSLEKGRQDRKSRDSENDEGKERQSKESGGQTPPNRDDSRQESSHRSKSTDTKIEKRKDSPQERRKSHSKRSPSPPERKNDRRRSREEVDQNRSSRNSRSTSADVLERKQRSKSGSYERDKDLDKRSGVKDENRRESKDGSRRKSESLDREGHTQERRLSDGDRRRNSEDTKRKSIERECPRSREEDRKRESGNTDRRSSNEGRTDDRDREKDRSKERQYHDQEKPSRRKSRERERSKEHDRKERGRNTESSRERTDRSKDFGSKSEPSRGDKKTRTESSKENEKAGTKDPESEHRQSSKVPTTLNIQDIPMPPEKAPVAEAKKEPSPIMYVTSSSCKDDIIKVKSKWDTDSEDDESGASGPSQNRRGGRGGGGRGTAGNQRPYGQSSQYSGTNGSGGAGGGQNYGGYRRHANENCLDNIHVSSTSNSSGTTQSCPHLFLLAEQPSYHEPLRLRGGCVASPPPRYDSDYSDSDVSFSSSSFVDSEEYKRDSSHEGRQRVERRHKSSSSDRSSGGRSKKRFKPSKRRESRSSSRSSSASSSRSQSSRPSSRSPVSISSRSRSRSPSSSRSSSSISRRSYNSDSHSSKSSQPYESSRESSKKARTPGWRRSDSNTDSSDSEGAGEYDLFDSWEDYMDSRGHDIGKQVPSSSTYRRTVKLEAGGSTVEKHSRASPVHSYIETSSEEDQEQSDTDDHVIDEGNETKVRKTDHNEEEDENTSVGKTASKCGSGLDVSESEGKSDSVAADNQRDMRSENAESSKSPTPLAVQEERLEKHSTEKDEDRSVARPDMDRSVARPDMDRSRRYPDSSSGSKYSQGQEYEHRVGHGHSRDHYRHDLSSARGHPSEYGNQLKVGQSHRSTHRNEGPNVHEGYHAGDQRIHDRRGDQYNDDRHHQRDRSFRDDQHHPRHHFQREERRDYHQRPERGFENQRYGRRERNFHRRRDDDWGRGVKEVQERGTFFRLVTKSREELISQLNSVCSTALELVCHEHRQWWL